MLKILMPTIMLFFTTWAAPPKQMWTTILLYSFLIALFSLNWLFPATETGWLFLNMNMATDAISTPLLILTYWLLPLMILANQKPHNLMKPVFYQRIYMALMVSLQIFLILAFSATELMMFYLMFEATLIPTLIIITRWGNQMERLNAGTYFLFYTLVGSMPLLVALLITQNSTGTVSFLTLNLTMYYFNLSIANKVWWAACLMAFLVKMPLYGLHIWLPKAHVEASIAGSMILAAVLLKLGGYGLLRIMTIIKPLTKEFTYPLIIVALWGIVMGSFICFRQTDLKSLIAYSSVSHMGLVTAGILIQTPWSFTGALILMIAHGLTSSALFCLANTNYERTYSRTMTLTRGLQMVLPLMTMWWLTAGLANLALPPFPNLLGELMTISSLFNWTSLTLLITGLSILATATYSLYILLTTQWGPLPQCLHLTHPSYSREHLIMMLHMTPLLLLIFKPQMIVLSM